MHRLVRFSVLCLVSCSAGWASARADEAIIRLSDRLPQGYARDGSVSYQGEIQRILDSSPAGAVIEFPPIVYTVDETGWTVKSGMTLRMHGARFQFGEECSTDGALFQGVDVVDVSLFGGTVVGRNDVWVDGVNIRGIFLEGRCARIRVREMQFQDLSSNAIGIFGTEEQPVRDVWIRDVIAENCCKRYADYLSDEKHEKGSVREDQGDVALYFVEDFVVSGCRFERSRSDGTHFYRSQNGQITDNRIYRAKMGGYFVETCQNVVGRGNVILENGSRGVTIERDSRNCLFADNVVRFSGREGLWAPDCVGLVVTGNIFDRNGRKPNGPEKRFVWNANITINEAHVDPTGAPTQDYFLSDNVITTSASQIAAIRVETLPPETNRIILRNNVLLGENHTILIEGPAPEVVEAADNFGATVQYADE